jgi:putative NADPH-quinone reductase
MAKSVAIIQGHPDAAGGHLDHALAEAYAAGAEAAAHEVRRIPTAALDFPLLRSATDFQHGTPPPAIQEAQATLAGADHWLIVFPLWLGSTPALLKGFLEQVMRPGFAFRGEDRQMPGGLLKGKSARVVVTMGMPALLYRTYFRAHGVKYLERSVLRFAGMRPVRRSLFGLVEARSDRTRQRWLARMERLGRRAR